MLETPLQIVFLRLFYQRTKPFFLFFFVNSTHQHSKQLSNKQIIKLQIQYIHNTNQRFILRVALKPLLNGGTKGVVRNKVIVGELKVRHW